MTEKKIEDLTEVENKYLVSKKVAFSIIEKAMKKGKHKLDFINQVYLFDESANIQYNLKKEQFEVQVIHEGRISEILIIPVVDEHEKETLNDLLADMEGQDLTKGKGTFRIRYYDGRNPIFAMKMKKSGVAGTFEFEYEVSRNIKHMKNGDEFEDILFGIKSRIVKMRHSVERNNKIYEIDIYSEFEFITLEVEFKNELEQQAFEEDFEFIRNISNDSEYKNKNLAKTQLTAL